MPHQRGQQFQRIGFDAEGPVLRAQMARHPLGVGRLVETVIALEADAEGCHRRVAVLDHQRRDQAAVESAA